MYAAGPLLSLFRHISASSKGRKDRKRYRPSSAASSVSSLPPLPPAGLADEHAGAGVAGEVVEGVGLRQVHQLPGALRHIRQVCRGDVGVLLQVRVQLRPPVPVDGHRHPVQGVHPLEGPAPGPLQGLELSLVLHRAPDPHVAQKLHQVQVLRPLIVRGEEAADGIDV